MDAPVLGVLTVAGGAQDLGRTYRSLAAQTDRRWEWCLALRADDPRRTAADIPFDPRVTFVGDAEDPGEQLVAAFTAATAEHVMLVRPGDRLAEEAVADVASRVAPGAWGYTDERTSSAVWHKPDHSPERLRSQPYAVPTAILPRSVLADLGGPTASPAAWYDAVLRVSERAGAAVRVPVPHLIRAVDGFDDGFVAGTVEDSLRAAREHCDRVGIALDGIEPVVVGGRTVGQRLHRTRRRTPSVSVVVPTRGTTTVVSMGRSRCHVVELARSLWAEGRYPGLELVVVYDADTPGEVLDQLREVVGEGLRLTRFDGPFHFSRKCNLGAVVATGEYVCFLNDDMEVLAPEWLAEMVAQLEDPGVGAVGARLVFPDGSLQHMGHQYFDGGAGHPLLGCPPDSLARGAAAQVAGERSGVTAACMLVRREQFLRLGGFSDQLPLNYNDVDLCLKIRDAGLRIVYTPHAVLLHFESQSRVPRIVPTEVDLIRRRWWHRMNDDPYLMWSEQPDCPPATSDSHIVEETHA